MRRYLPLTAVAVAALLPGLLPGASLATASAGARNGAWGKAEEVPGIAALDQGGSSDLRSVSCGSAGNCSAGGGYGVPSGSGQAYVASQRNGTWGTARRVPGLAALNAGGSASIYTVSCASAGNCGAGGFYRDRSGHAQAFVVTETNGTWGTAEQVPGIAALNTGGSAAVESISCAPAGSCAAGGNYLDGSRHQQVFVATETNGTWGTAEQVPGTAALNQGGFARFISVSCAPAGDCAAGGDYIPVSGRQQAFVVTETNGAWGTAEQVPGTPALTGTHKDAWLASVSCAPAGGCAAGGAGGGQGFAVTETNGIWGTAQVLSGAGRLHPDEVESLSCPSAGDCSAVGLFNGTGTPGVFVATQASGTWGTAHQIPGLAALDQAGNDLAYGVSCGSPGNCSAGGYYQSGTYLHAFVANQVSGTWNTAREVPGMAALGNGSATLWSVSCAAGGCSAGGDYGVNTGHQQAFVVSETP